MPRITPAPVGQLRGSDRRCAPALIAADDRRGTRRSGCRSRCRRGLLGPGQSISAWRPTTAPSGTPPAMLLPSRIRSGSIPRRERRGAGQCDQASWISSAISRYFSHRKNAEGPGAGFRYPGPGRRARRAPVRCRETGHVVDVDFHAEQTVHGLECFGASHTVVGAGVGQVIHRAGQDADLLLVGATLPLRFKVARVRPWKAPSKRSTFLRWRP